MMEDFYAYFHIEESNGIYHTLGHIHDSFTRNLPEDLKVYVGWEAEKNNSIRYRTRIESPHADNARITTAFRGIAASFEHYMRLAILLAKPYKGKFVLLDLVEP